MSVSKKKTTKVPVTRSRNGCLTCRSRHIKCDEGLPNCKNCIKSNKICKRGTKLNFFKTITGGSHSYFNSNYSNASIRFLDQSYTIHKIYKNNKFHDYQHWLRDHSKQELWESDEDFKRSIEFNSNSNIFIFQQLSDASDSETISNRGSSSGTLSNFDLSYFISKVVSYFVVPNVNQALFVNSHRNSILLHFGGMNLTQVVDNELTLSDFEEFVNFLQVREIENTTPIYPGLPVSIESVSNFTIFLNCLVFALKTNRVYLFQPSFMSSKIFSFIIQRIQEEKYQTFENLMNFFELCLLDLNESLKSNTPSLVMNSVQDISSFEFLLNKILNLNLFDDLSYFILRITIILIKLNNFKHFYNETQSFSLLSSLIIILKDLKDLENNQILTMYFPSHSRTSISEPSAGPPSITSRSSSSTTASISSYSASKPPIQFQFQNLKIQRFHILYNYVLLFIAKYYSKHSDVRNIVFHTPGILLNLWNGFEQDVFKRMSYLTFNYDFANDPFMSFIKKVTLY